MTTDQKVGGRLPPGAPAGETLDAESFEIGPAEVQADSSLFSVAESPWEGFMGGMNESIRLTSEHPVDASASFEEFVEAHHARLFGAMCLVTGDRYEAEEIAQEAFLRILERWNYVSTLQDPIGYLYRTAMNEFRKRYRRASLAIRRAVSLAPPPESFDVADDRELVIHGLAQIPKEQRAALVVTALLGYSSEEAGRILGASSSTVRARATRARTALRRAIGEPT
jgi:RNA polymerase sigma factor (sigma-70 family)